MTKTERELVRDIRVVFARANHRVLNTTQSAYVKKGGLATRLGYANLA